MQRTKKLPIKTKTGVIHVLDTHTGVALCGRILAVEGYAKQVTGRDICGGCLRVLCAIWEPQATPAYEPPPF